MRSIRDQEGGNYTAPGKSGEYGAFQWMPGNFEAASKQFTGSEIPVKQSTPAEQNYVAYNQIKEQLNQGKSPAQIASWWNSGEYDAYKDPNFKGVNKAGAAYDVPGYVNSVGTKYTTYLKQFSTVPPATGGPNQQTQAPLPAFLQAAGSVARTIGSEAANVGESLPGVKTLGSAIGGSIAAIGEAATGHLNRAAIIAGQQPSALKVGGAATEVASTPAAIATAPESFLGMTATGGAYGAAQGAGSALEQGKNAAGVATDTALQGLIGALTGVVGTVVSGVGKVASKLPFPSSEAEEGLIQTYKAGKPFLQRIAAAIAGTTKAPRTTAETAFQKGLTGTERMVGVQAVKAGRNIWSKVIQPALDAVKEPVDIQSFFNDAETQIKSSVTELSRQNSLVNALNSIRDDYEGVTSVPLKQLQKYKEEWAKPVPQRAYRGEDITGALNNVRNTLAGLARTKIYNSIGNDIRQSYIDYGNLKAIAAWARKESAGAKFKGGTGRFIGGLKDMILTPVATLAGQSVYALGQGLEVYGSAGLKTGEDWLKSLVSSSPADSSGYPDAQTAQNQPQTTPQSPVLPPKYP